MSKITNDGLTRSGTGCCTLYSWGNDDIGHKPYRPHKTPYRP